MNPAMIVGHYGAEQNIGVIAALRAAGYTGPYIIAAYGASEDTVRQAAAQAGSGENIYMVSRYAVPTDNAPGMADLIAAAKKYGVANPTSMHVTGWVLGMFAERGVEKMRRQLHAGRPRQSDAGREARHQGADRRTDRNVRRKPLRPDLLAALPLGK